VGVAQDLTSFLLAHLYLNHHGDKDAVKQEFVDIELTSKVYRTHRGPSDQQSCFLNLLYKEVIEVDAMVCES
jgi:hypothetical protein